MCESGILNDEELLDFVVEEKELNVNVFLLWVLKAQNVYPRNKS